MTHNAQNEPGLDTHSTEIMAAGYICSKLLCCAERCTGTHYSYYSMQLDGLVPIRIGETTLYINPEGFHIYYQRQLNNANEQAYHLLTSSDDIPEPPRKKRRFY